MFVRSKVRKGGAYHYLVTNVRVEGRVRQKVVCYLGRYDCIEDAYANAVGARRARLARFRDAADIHNDHVLWLQERQYRRDQRRGWSAPESALRLLLPTLPALCDLPMGRLFRPWRRRRTRRI